MQVKRLVQACFLQLKHLSKGKIISVLQWYQRWSYTPLFFPGMSLENPWVSDFHGYSWFVRLLPGFKYAKGAHHTFAKLSEVKQLLAVASYWPVKQVSWISSNSWQEDLFPPEMSNYSCVVWFNLLVTMCINCIDVPASFIITLTFINNFCQETWFSIWQNKVTAVCIHNRCRVEYSNIMSWQPRNK